MDILTRTTLIGFCIMAVACSRLDKIGQKSQTSEAYIVVLNKASLQAENLGEASIFEAVTQQIKSLAFRHQSKADRIFKKVLYGGVIRLTQDQAELLAKDPAVAYVERDQIIHVDNIQNNPTWGLDRLDQANLPLDHVYNYPSQEGATVNVYVIDTGILINHQEFAGRAISGADLVENDTTAIDCNGHGTHVAGTIGGQTYGVNKFARLIAVRVLDCSGSGSFSNVIAGIDWVAAHHTGPSVANMSLGGPASQAVDQAVQAAIQSGVSFVVAGGNESQSACNSSPARVLQAITVGATNSADQKSDFSNYGNCLDIFAPGENITSAWYTNPLANNTISGTSMASPHVAGVASLYLAKHSSAAPSEVTNAILNGSLSGRVTQAGSGSPNRFLNVGFLQNSIPNDPGPDDPRPHPMPNDPPQDPPTGPPTETLPPRLANHQSVNNLQGTKGSEIRYVITLPKGAKNLTVRINGGSGDADLYVRAAEVPTDSIYDCRPYTSTSNEICQVGVPQAGLYYISIRGYVDFQGLGLSVDFDDPSTGEPSICLLCLEEDGRLSKSRESKYFSAEGSDWPSGSLTVNLSGPINADFDLYLQKQEGREWVQLAQSISASSSETIHYQISAGRYRIQVSSYSGSGNFHLRTQLMGP